MGGRGAGSGFTRVIMAAESKTIAKENVKLLPHQIKDVAERFISKKTTNFYKDYKITKKENGNYLLQSTKPGNVPGSKAIYYKEISTDGNTLYSYKNTYDQFGKFVHRKYKYGE